MLPEQRIAKVKLLEEFARQSATIQRESQRLIQVDNTAEPRFAPLKEHFSSPLGRNLIGLSKGYLHIHKFHQKKVLIGDKEIGGIFNPRKTYYNVKFWPKSDKSSISAIFTSRAIGTGISIMADTGEALEEGVIHRSHNPYTGAYNAGGMALIGSYFYYEQSAEKAKKIFDMYDQMIEQAVEQIPT